MNPEAADLPRRLAELRQAFDRSFVEPPRPALAEFEDLLAVRIGTDPYAVRLAATAGLVADRPVTRLPGAPPELLGVAGLRGAVVPVYDLGTLLGRPRAATASDAAPRWLVLVAGSPPVAVAFDRLDGHLRVPRNAIAERTAEPSAAGASQHNASGASARQHSAIVRTAGAVRAVIDLAAVRAAITARNPHSHVEQER